MIYVEMFGRLGNQFFRYAAARALQLQQFPKEKLVLNFQQVNDANKTDPTFYNVLSDYNVPNYDVWDGEGKVIFKESSLKQKMICIPYYMGLKNIHPESMNEEVAYENRWSNRLRRNGVYWFRRGYYPFVSSTARNKFISGNFEDPRYFECIRDVLLKEFTTSHGIVDKNNELYKKIRSTESVCISVRRGDFETNPKFKALQSVCHKEYFEQAIEAIKKQVEHPVFFLFSDDVEWVKENVKTGCETYCEDGTDQVWEKLRMMSMCRHFIISNSTFSWWSQWLSTNENKIVVSPERWFNNNYKSPLIDPKWIKIKV
jgi:hypothetical protein